MSDEKKLPVPENRFVIRPDTNPSSDEKAVTELAGDIADWVLAQRARVQREISTASGLKRAKQHEVASSPPAPSEPLPLAAKNRR